MLASSVIIVAPIAGPAPSRAARASSRLACSASPAMEAVRFGAPRAGVSLSASRRPTRLAAKGKKGAPEPAKEKAPEKEKSKAAPAGAGGADPQAIEKDLVDKMEKAVDAVKRNFATIRTGRANSAMLDRIQVEVYGAMTPLKSMANVSTPDAQTLVIQPFDKSTVKDIERAIQMSDLGINPSNDGNLVRLNIPPLTQDRRKEMTKQVGKLAEDGKVALRNVRRDALKAAEKLEKDKTVSEDEATKLKDKIQKLTDGFVKQVEDVESAKNKELLQV